MELDHVQIAIPAGGEAEVRHFFGDLLGLIEIPKPTQLERQGCWLQLGDRQLHFGVDPDFRPALKAHVAIAVHDIAGLRTKLEEAGHDARPDVPVDGRARFFTHDPFGNRIEFIEAVSAAN